MVFRILAVVIVVVACASAAEAGGSIFSPNGLGDPQTSGGVRATGLGGGGIGLADSASFNSSNPALAALAHWASFRFSGTFSTWSTSADGRTDTDTEFLWRDFCLYFPVTARWRIGIGAEPSRHMDLRTFGNRVARFLEPDGNVTQVRYEERNVWNGGTTEWRVDNAFRFSPRLSLGVSAIYVTLHNERNRKLDMEEVVSRSYYFDSQYLEVERFRGWAVAGGAYFAPTDRWGLGAVFRPRSRGDWTYEFSKFGTDSVVKADRRGDSPGEFKLGVSYFPRPRLVLVADVQTGQWKEGDLGMIADRAALPAPENPLFVSAGIERIAGRPPQQSGFQNWGLRAGAYYRRHYWPLHDGQAVEDVGMTAGVSIPFEGSKSWLHAACEGGLRGLDEGKLGAGEMFFRLSLQVEVGEMWFQRTKPRLPQ